MLTKPSTGTFGDKPCEAEGWIAWVETSANPRGSWTAANQMIRPTTAPSFDLGHSPLSCRAIQMKVPLKVNMNLGRSPID